MSSVQAWGEFYFHSSFLFFFFPAWSQRTMARSRGGEKVEGWGRGSGSGLAVVLARCSTLPFILRHLASIFEQLYSSVFRLSHLVILKQQGCMESKCFTQLISCVNNRMRYM